MPSDAQLDVGVDPTRSIVLYVVMRRSMQYVAGLWGRGGLGREEGS